MGGRHRPQGVTLEAARGSLDVVRRRYSRIDCKSANGGGLAGGGGAAGFAGAMRPGDPTGKAAARAGRRPDECSVASQ